MDACHSVFTVWYLMMIPLLLLDSYDYKNGGFSIDERLNKTKSQVNCARGEKENVLEPPHIMSSFVLTTRYTSYTSSLW